MYCYYYFNENKEEKQTMKNVELTSKTTYISSSKTGIVRKTLFAENHDKANALLDSWKRMGEHSGYSYTVESQEMAKASEVAELGSLNNASYHGFGMYKSIVVEELEAIPA